MYCIVFSHSIRTPKYPHRIDPYSEQLGLTIQRRLTRENSETVSPLCPADSVKQAVVFHCLSAGPAEEIMNWGGVKLRKSPPLPYNEGRLTKFCEPRKPGLCKTFRAQV